MKFIPETDQFLRIEEGYGIVEMGDDRDNLDFQRRVADGDIVVIPAGKWHNLTNIGQGPLSYIRFMLLRSTRPVRFTGAGPKRNCSALTSRIKTKRGNLKIRHSRLRSSLR